MWMQLMKQTARIISTYASDTSGVCSALYELGGMSIMHDASGCNSTYSTHDEPRWYDHNSLIFISALTETEAILGDDGKLIRDTVDAAREFSPRFIALAGTPIPMMTGTDFTAIAGEIESRTGIPTFGFATDGMHAYAAGVSEALAAVAQRLCKADVPKAPSICVNILGLTPLDFSVCGADKAMEAMLADAGIGVLSQWAMGSDLTTIQNAGAAWVNLVVTSGGLQAAKVLQKRFGTPYVVATPCGEAWNKEIVRAVQDSAKTGESIDLCRAFPDADTVIIGESVTALSLANALYLETGKGAHVLCAVDGEDSLLRDGCLRAIDEDEIIPHLADCACVIADPLYKPICPPAVRFIPLPHEGFSGRIYRNDIFELVTGFSHFIKENDL